VTVPAGDDWFLKAMATKSGMINSDVTTSGEYNNTNPITAPAGAPPPGGNAAATAFTAPAPRTVSYAFTAADPLNRDSVTENGVLTNYTANKLNQYSNVRGQALGYDNNFNLSDDNTHSYSFNAQNELVGVDGVTVQLVYDGLGRVLKRTINNNATIFVYDGWKVIEELDGSGNLKAYNIYGAGPDEILWRNQNGTNLIYHTDKEGNVMFLLDGAGNGTERYTYDAFGAPRITDWDGNLRGVSAWGNRYMFNGKDYVAEMGLYDYRHRWYQPQLGRFLQVDPKGFDAGDENLFRYCLDDPVDRTDPDGLDPRSDAERAADQQRRYEQTVDVRQEVTGSHIPQVVGSVTFIGNSATTVKAAAAALIAGGGNFNVAQISSVGPSLRDKDGHLPSGRFPSEAAAANRLIRDSYRAQQDSGPGPTARYEHYGYGSVNKADSHDWITYGPYKGKKGQVSGMNTSDFLRADASPDGYRRVFSVYTHINWRRDVDAGDRMGFAGMAGSPRVYLATPPMPGSSAPEPNVLVWH